MPFELTPDEAKKVIRHVNRVLSNVSVARKAIEKGLECVVRRPVNELPVELQRRWIFSTRFMRSSHAGSKTGRTKKKFTQQFEAHRLRS